MARGLNKNRMSYSWLSVILCILVIVFTKPAIPYQSDFHEIAEFIGYFLVAVCALGRVYTSAFLGGFKNAKLIDYGPFSIVRNPLYLFSLIGIFGLSLTSGHLLAAIFLVSFFGLMYHFLMKREEAFLLETFGLEYEIYKNRTPRLIPRFSLYHCPEEIGVRPQFITNAAFDAIWWFAAFPAFELIEHFQEIGIIPTFNGG